VGPLAINATIMLPIMAPMMVLLLSRLLLDHFRTRKKAGMTLNIWQNFFHIARIFCTPNIHYVKILHIKFEEIPIAN